MKGFEATLSVQPGTFPKFFKPRSVPHSLNSAIKQDLEWLEKLGVIEKVQFSDWAAPIVPVPKRDGTVCLRGDYKVTINWFLNLDQYPVLKAEDLFAQLARGKKFSKLDLSHAYQQVLLNQPPIAVLHSWIWLDAPWKMIHVDFAGPFMGSTFMVVINAHSMWLEVIPMATTTTDKTPDALHSLFAAHGLPQQLVTDYGPLPQNSRKLCMAANGI